MICKERHDNVFVLDRSLEGACHYHCPVYKRFNITPRDDPLMEEVYASLGSVYDFGCESKSFLLSRPCFLPFIL